jgi:hypothetical protein
MPRSPFDFIYMPQGPPDLRWDRLEGASKLNFSEPQRTALADSMSRYLYVCEAQRMTAHTKPVKRHLESIEKHTQTLIKLLSPYGKNGPTDHEETNVRHAVFGLFSSNFDRDGLIRHLIKLRTDAHNALKDGEPGHPDMEEALDALIQEWHAVYHQAGGRGRGCTRSGSSSTGKGPFLELLHVALQGQKNRVSETLIQSNRYALAIRIIAVLKDTTSSDSAG